MPHQKKSSSARMHKAEPYATGTRVNSIGVEFCYAPNREVGWHLRGGSLDCDGERAIADQRGSIQADVGRGAFDRAEPRSEAGRLEAFSPLGRSDRRRSFGG